MDPWRSGDLALLLLCRRYFRRGFGGIGSVEVRELVGLWVVEVEERLMGESEGWAIGDAQALLIHER